MDTHSHCLETFSKITPRREWSTPSRVKSAPNPEGTLRFWENDKKVQEIIGKL